MECERCLTGNAAKYRVYSDIIDMKVCAACADVALEVGLVIEALDAKEKSQRLRRCKNFLRCIHVST
jgi:hypothetical protein